MTVVVTMLCDFSFVYSGVYGGITSGEEAPVTREPPVEEGLVAKRAPISTALRRVEVGGEYRVMVCEADTPSSFYCQLVSDADSLASLMSSLNSMCEERSKKGFK